MQSSEVALVHVYGGVMSFNMTIYIAVVPVHAYRCNDHIFCGAVVVASCIWCICFVQWYFAEQRGSGYTLYSLWCTLFWAMIILRSSVVAVALVHSYGWVMGSSVVTVAPFTHVLCVCIIIFCGAVWLQWRSYMHMEGCCALLNAHSYSVYGCALYSCIIV